eukprot:8868582-Pyramimonas_sp.AAC.1
MGNPSGKCERADSGNTLKNGPKHEQHDCQQRGGYQIQWKKEGKHWKEDFGVSMIAVVFGLSSPPG